MKKTLMLLLVFLLILATPTTVFAEKESPHPGYSEVPTTGTPSPYEDFGKSTIQSKFPELNYSPLSSSPYFIKTESEIYKLSSASIKGKVYTSANRIVDRVGYYLYFQMWDGYSWKTIGTVSKYYNDNISISLYHTMLVSKGHYYRVKARHYITQNSSNYYKTSTSDYIYLN